MVTNELEFGAWLETQPQEICIGIAFRSILRSIPFALTVSSSSDITDRMALAALRSTLVGGLSTVRASVDIKDAAKQASAAVLRSRKEVAGEGKSLINSHPPGATQDALVDAESLAKLVATSEKRLVLSVCRASSRATSSERNSSFKALAEAAFKDTEIPFSRLLIEPVEIPGVLMHEFVFWRNGGYEILNSEGPWAFWARWYDAAMAGDPLPWDLQEQIALIPDQIWEAGPEAVAKRIREIETEFYGEPLDQDALRSHAETLVASPSLHADAAISAANLIEKAVETYKAEAPANSLPDGFERFKKLSARFGSISVVLLSDRSKDEKIEALQAQINALHADKLALQKELSEAQARLRDARLDKLEAAQMRTFGEKLQTTLTNVTLLGTIGLQLMMFFGVSAEDLNYDGFKAIVCGLSEDMCAARASEEVAELPPDAEV